MRRWARRELAMVSRSLRYSDPISQWRYSSKRQYSLRIVGTNHHFFRRRRGLYLKDVQRMLSTVARGVITT